MTSQKIGCIVLAAGQSKRFKSSISKIFHDLAGRSVLGHVLHTLEQLPITEIIIVASPLTPVYSDYKHHKIAIQNEQLGTAHAAMTGMNQLSDDISDVIILCGDTPLLTIETLTKLLASSADLTLLSATLPDNQRNASYGRIVFNNDRPCRITEYKDADEMLRNSPLINSGVYKINQKLLRKLIPLISNANAASEYYLTDLVHLAIEHDATTKAINVDFDEVAGINTREDLEKVDSIIQERLRAVLMMKGVTFQQPHTTRLSIDTCIGQDTTVEPSVVFKKGVNVENNVKIKSFCYLEDCTLRSGVSVGPHAHIRGGSVLDEGAEIGNFVELKATHLGKKAKAKHLTYLGDTTVGEASNIGAGTITANYDGFLKHKTKIGERVHIGVDTILVAPVFIGNDAMTAAGSVITNDVPTDALAINRIPQTNKHEWAKHYKTKMKAKKDGLKQG
ncbi:MAG: bifunctional UDP-N-acetylglucosamine diphosphorylase/glucosamine-1-phosphate N-acetyltransferase GlmU [Alphaproteobacteria bacterium]|nr:bifunctional UDP-N-acetylglucosamine diphosphorylase/glucosamine-1-phosphate N-acetyltransferase GlmU [Alphaproteobacteria bacterium]MDP5012737.1 bifunctional UDP-N-acetylglucosamine diphosphorylase/glucosamine-1-phosphate N-acetyltransferase GlmU [Alphaproteobacteria bacterium]